MIDMKFDGYLICSDHDGTVAEWGELLQVNIEAIKYFQDNGGIFTVATGRRHDFVAEKYAGIIKPHVPCIISNGTMLYDITDDKVIYKNFLTVDDYDVLFDAFEHSQHALRFRIELEEESLWFDIDKTCIDDINKALNGREVSKFVMEFKNEDEDKTLELQKYLTDKYGDRYTVVRAWYTGLEFFTKTGGKGDCISRVKEIIKDKLGIEIHTVIGMGDFENDISLIKMADIGVAMGNAPMHVKEHADKIAEKSADGGFAKFVYSL